jgi:hypothetical protein
MADKASNWVPLTNEKLYFSQILLGYLKEEQEKASVFSKNRMAALEESVQIHLYNAYVSLLCELAAEHSLPFNAETLTLNELNTALMERDDGRREVAELLQLIEDPSSWLSQLLKGYRNRFISKQQKSEYQGETPELISAVAIDVTVQDEPESLDLHQAHIQLKTLVDSIRSYRLED